MLCASLLWIAHFHKRRLCIKHLQQRRLCITHFHQTLCFCELHTFAPETSVNYTVTAPPRERRNCAHWWTCKTVNRWTALGPFPILCLRKCMPEWVTIDNMRRFTCIVHCADGSKLQKSMFAVIGNAEIVRSICIAYKLHKSTKVHLKCSEFMFAVLWRTGDAPSRKMVSLEDAPVWLVFKANVQSICIDWKLHKSKCITYYGFMWTK